MRSNNNTFTDVDQRALTIVVGAGIYPVTLMLMFLTIASANQISRFMFGVSFGVWVWSIVIARRAVGSVNVYRPQQSPVDLCGGMTLPEFCGRSRLQYKSAEYYSTLIPLIICFGIWLGLHRDRGNKSSIQAPPVEAKDPPPSSVSKDEANCIVLLHDWCNNPSTGTPPVRCKKPAPRGNSSDIDDAGVAKFGVFSLYFLLGTYLAFLACFVHWFSHLLKLAKDSLSHEWTFGQITALMLWLPTGFEVFEKCYDGLRYLCLMLSDLTLAFAKILCETFKALKTKEHFLLNFPISVQGAVVRLARFYRTAGAAVPGENPDVHS